jgi:hypothetical protein
MTLSITTFYVECHNAESHYAECHNVPIALLNVIMLRVVMPNVVGPTDLVTFEVAKNVRTPTLLAKIRLGCKLMKATNSLTNCTVALFTLVFITFSHFHPSLIFAGKARSLTIGKRPTCKGPSLLGSSLALIQSKVRLIDLPTNIRLG